MKRREPGDKSGSSTAQTSLASSPASVAVAGDLPGGGGAGPVDWFKVQVPFKNPNFERQFSQSIIISGKKRQWRTLKQILAQESASQSQDPEGNVSDTTSTAPSFGSIDAPPSFKPAKKYSDISGLESNYTDPHSKMNFASTAEFRVIKKLPSDLVSGYLALRRANVQLQ